MKKLFVFAALILISATAVFAQTQVTSGSIAMPGLTSSPQFTATQGMFRSTADNFIRPDYYTAMTFDKFYAMTSFAAALRAQLGYAGKIGNLYISAAYGGSFWANYTPLNYEETNVNWLGAGPRTVPVYYVSDPANANIFNPANPFVAGRPENRIAILIGVADMGFRLTFSSIGHEYIGLKDDFVARNDVFLTGTAVPGNAFFKSYEAERGTISPQIAWAMGKDLTENGIRPYVLLDLDFVRSYIKAEATTGTGFNGVAVRNSENHFDPKLTLGLGGYTFYKNSGSFVLLADFEYALALKFYENEYSYTDGSGRNRISKINGLNRLVTDNIGDTNRVLSENAYHGHRITPALVGRWSGGPLALRFRLNLPVILYGEESTTLTPVAASTSGDLDSGDKTNTFFIGFFPNLRLAAQWKIIPKLTLNIGGQVSFGVSRTTTDTSVREAYGSTNNALTIGFTFLPTDNLTFEVSSGIGSDNNINFNDDNGLLNFTSLLVGLKF
jgi:hypothetical protein